MSHGIDDPCDHHPQPTRSRRTLVVAAVLVTSDLTLATRAEKKPDAPFDADSGRQVIPVPIILTARAAVESYVEEANRFPRGSGTSMTPQPAEAR